MKFKKIPRDYLPIILDRLTRFEPVQYRYSRVFNDIIDKFALEKVEDNKINEYATEIINCSCINSEFNENIINILIEMEKKYFYYNELSYQYLSNRINFQSIINTIKDDNKLTKNAIWLKEISKNKNIYELRKNKALLYPIEKIILCEGQTEFLLLDTIFKTMDFDINKNGILIIPAGGKNQVARKYYSMLEYTKLPFFILLDKDGNTIKDYINNKIREKDAIYLIQGGEFEDIIPINMLVSTINSIYYNELSCSKNDFIYDKNVKNLEYIYKKYGFGDYKKAHFAKELKGIIEKKYIKDDFLNSEFVDILNALQQI